jgi:retron-type reverse transcriptase
MPVDNIQVDFLSLENFRLAWERVLRSQHAENKDRIALRVFASGIDHNLEQIIREIQAGTYTPSPAPKIYIPKITRTLRTIPVLTVRDRVVYQAIGNMIIREAFPDLSVVANRHVFAHLPQSNSSLFTLMPWQRQIHEFIQNYERIWKQGNKWVVEADISAFYASIDHGLLSDFINDRWIADENVLNLLKQCLRAWTAHERGPELSRGVPEGYETSDLLATLFLLPVDEYLVRGFRYLRYVDDIRILSPNRDVASRALVALDLELKARALVLQTRKTGLEEVKSLEDEKDRLRRRLSQISVRISLGENQQDELKELFFRAWNQLDDSPEAADSTLAFTLHRLDADTTVRSIAARLLGILPWRSDVINEYLAKFQHDEYVIQGLMNILQQHKVYAWHLANCMRTIGKVAHPNVYRVIALDWIHNTDFKWFQRLAAVEALQQDQDSHAALHSAIRGENSVIVKSALIVACSFQAYETGSRDEVALLIRRALEDDNPYIKLLGIWLHQQFSDIPWAAINFQRTLGSLQPLVPELAGQPGETPCFIKHTLRTIYEVEIAEAVDFQSVFGDYPGAVLDLRKAVPYYYTDASLYIGLINSFNHRVAIALKGVVGSNVPDNQFDNMLRSHDFTSHVPQVALYFRECNELRNRTTGFHPYASVLGTWSQLVTHKEKDRLHKGLKLAYQEFVSTYQTFLGIP